SPDSIDPTWSTDSRGWGCASPERAARFDITGDSRSDPNGAAKGPASATHTPTPAATLRRIGEGLVVLWERTAPGVGAGDVRLRRGALGVFVHPWLPQRAGVGDAALVDWSVGIEPAALEV